MEEDNKQKYVTLADFDAIKDLYEKAKEEGRDRFEYKGHTVLVAYAKYLLEHMATLMETPKK